MRLSWGLPLEHFSASSLNTYVMCPEQFRRRYLLKQRDKFWSDRFLGIVDHSIQAENLTQKIDTGVDLDTEAMRAGYARVWSDTIDEEGEPEWRDDDPSKMYDRGLESVLLYHNKVSPRIQPIAVEEKIEFMVPSIPIPMIGYIDVRTRDRIIDRKTSKTKLSKPKPNWTIQARTYSYATGLPLEIHLVTRQATPQIVTAEESPALLIPVRSREATERFLVQIARRINDDYSRYGADEPWPALGVQHSFACGFCRFGPQYEASCSMWDDFPI